MASSCNEKICTGLARPSRDLKRRYIGLYSGVARCGTCLVQEKIVKLGDAARLRGGGTIVQLPLSFHRNRQDLVAGIALKIKSVRLIKSKPFIRATVSSSNGADAFSGNLSSVHKGGRSDSSVEPLPTKAARAGAISTEYTLRKDSSVAEPLPGFPKVAESWIEIIRGMFGAMSGGEISISAYDTAWVSRVQALDGSRRPQFPESVQWIIDNQLPDGSWGDSELFLAYDRVCSTVTCLVALETWNMGRHNIKRGLEFVKRNITKMESEVDEYMPVGFEIIFPAMLEDAKDLSLDLPYESPIVKRIQEERQRKLKRIPMDVLHNFSTALLYSLEGFHKIIDWEKVMKLQSKNGSFLFSPASTACALMYTRDSKCLGYLTSVLEKFNNAVPNVYPVDLFERLWVVDRIERLGIARHFEREIKDCLDYVYRYWTENGICWASESDVPDVDDTAMAFRLLRRHGYDVSPGVFSRFRKHGQFFCIEGQTSQAITGMYNLYRAAQTLFPGESILEEATNFTRSFLGQKLERNEIHDKWIISRGLQGEVKYSIDFPWYASLQRIETRQYLDQYGVNDVWIGKSLYKMPCINNETLLNLAKADYNFCQSFHRREVGEILRWNKDCKLDKIQLARQNPIECYFLVAATMFEPEMSHARLVWTRCAFLTMAIDNFFNVKGSFQELREFLDAVKSWDPSLIKGCSDEMKILFMGLYNTINTINQEGFKAQGRDISSHLRQFWVQWITSIMKEAEWRNHGYYPSFEEYMNVATLSIALEPIVLPSLFFVGQKLSEEIIAHADYCNIMQLVNTSGRLLKDIRDFKRESVEGKFSSIDIYMRENLGSTEEEAIAHFELMIQRTMEKLVQDVFTPTAVPKPFKQVHFNMAKIMNFFSLRTHGFSSVTQMGGYVKSMLFTKVP